MKTDYAREAWEERGDVCARCGREVAERQLRMYEDGGPPHCACGLALPTPPKDWLEAHGYDAEEDFCPTCGMAVRPETAWLDRIDRATDSGCIEAWCSEECSERYPRTAQQKIHWSDDTEGKS